MYRYNKYDAMPIARSLPQSEQSGRLLSLPPELRQRVQSSLPLRNLSSLAATSQLAEDDTSASRASRVSRARRDMAERHAPLRRLVLEVIDWARWFRRHFGDRDLRVSDAPVFLRAGWVPSPGPVRPLRSPLKLAVDDLGTGFSVQLFAGLTPRRTVRVVFRTVSGHAPGPVIASVEIHPLDQYRTFEVEFTRFDGDSVALLHVLLRECRLHGVRLSFDDRGDSFHFASAAV